MVFFVLVLWDRKAVDPFVLSPPKRWLNPLNQRPEVGALEGALEVATAATSAESAVSGQPGPGSAEEKIPVIPAEVVVPGKPVIDLRTDSPAKSFTPGTPAEEVEEKEKGRSALGSDDDVIVEERQAKRPRLHRELRSLSEQLGKAVSSMNETSQAMITMMEIFKKETDELAQTAHSLGLTGVNNKYYLAAITAFQEELRQVKWQVSGSGKNQVNVSLKSTAIGLGDKVMDLIKIQKEWRTESQGQHKALLEALSGLEIALTKQRTMSSAETGTVPGIRAELGCSSCHATASGTSAHADSPCYGATNGTSGYAAADGNSFKSDLWCPDDFWCSCR